MTGGPFLVKKVVTLQTLNGLFVELVYNRSSDDESRAKWAKPLGRVAGAIFLGLLVTFLFMLGCPSNHNDQSTGWRIYRVDLLGRRPDYCGW